MNPDTLTNSRVVERYLLGTLPEQDARSLEQLLLRQPALLETWDLSAVSGRLSRLLELTEEPRGTAAISGVRLHLGLLLGLAVAFVVAAGFAIGTWNARRAITADLMQARLALTAGRLTAPDHVSRIRVRPSALRDPPTPIDLGSRVTPAFAEIRVDTTNRSDIDYALTIRREDGTYWARIDHLHRDSNGDLSLAVNAATMPAGRYLWQVEFMDLAGVHHPAGHFLTTVSAQ